MEFNFNLSDDVQLTGKEYVYFGQNRVELRRLQADGLHETLATANDWRTVKAE